MKSATFYMCRNKKGIWTDSVFANKKKPNYTNGEYDIEDSCEYPSGFIERQLMLKKGECKKIKVTVEILKDKAK